MDLIAALRAFVRVTETGSFSAVARETHVSQSAVTRLVAQLEQHFDVRLFHRTTRRLSLTDDGQALLAHARHLIESADEMEAVLGRQSDTPRGLVRLGTSVAGGLFLATRLPVLLGRYPGLSVELVMRDQHTDMIDERLDLAFRSGEIADASLVARRVGNLGRAVVAAPIYLERYGAPSTPTDLADHVCLIHDAAADPEVWRFGGPDGPITVRYTAPFWPTTARRSDGHVGPATGLPCYRKFSSSTIFAPAACIGCWRTTRRRWCRYTSSTRHVATWRRAPVS